MVEGIDYSYGSGLGAAAIKSAGKSFVCRYLAPLPNTKVITRAEFENLRKAGLAVVLVYEAGGHDAGNAAGAAAARDADRQAAALGARGIPIYFAPADYDVPPGDQAGLNAYMDGAASVIGRARVGGYGGFWPVKRWFDGGHIHFGWQTYAWSGGQWDSRAQLQQYRNAVRLGPADVDLDRSAKSDYGQWPRPSAPKPAPAPKPAATPTEDDMPNGIQMPETVGESRTVSWSTGLAKGVTLVTDPQGQVVFGLSEHHTDTNQWYGKPDLKVGGAKGGRTRWDFANPDTCDAVLLTLKSGVGTTSLHT